MPIKRKMGAGGALLFPNIDSKNSFEYFLSEYKRKQTKYDYMSQSELSGMEILDIEINNTLYFAYLASSEEFQRNKILRFFLQTT